MPAEELEAEVRCEPTASVCTAVTLSRAVSDDLGLASTVYVGKYLTLYANPSPERPG